MPEQGLDLLGRQFAPAPVLRIDARKRLIKAANEGRAIARGEANPATYRVHVPAEVDVRKIRSAMKMSQAQFAARFGLSAATIKEMGAESSQAGGCCSGAASGDQERAGSCLSCA
jgi:hypothetical protein